MYALALPCEFTQGIEVLVLGMSQPGAPPLFELIKPALISVEPL